MYVSVLAGPWPREATGFAGAYRGTPAALDRIAPARMRGIWPKKIGVFAERRIIGNRLGSKIRRRWQWGRANGARPKNFTRGFQGLCGKTLLRRVVFFTHALLSCERRGLSRAENAIFSQDQPCKSMASNCQTRRCVVFPRVFALWASASLHPEPAAGKASGPGTVEVFRARKQKELQLLPINRQPAFGRRRLRLMNSRLV